MAQTAVPMECRLVSRPLATRRLLLTAMAALCALPALADGEEPVLKLRGEMTYLQRIALPENALAIVEVKPDDAPDGASVTAETRIPLRGGQVPVAFALDVPRAHLDASTTYVLRGAILVDSQPRWLSDPVAIDVQAATVDVGTLRLSPYEAPAPTPAPAPVVEEEEEAPAAERIIGEWNIETVGGETVGADIRATIDFGEDGGFSGRLCNAYRGPYKLDGASISFGNAAATLMACPEPQATLERALFAALPQATSWRIGEDGALLVLDGDDATLIRARR
jgi:putative lipoprotein